MKEKPTFDSMEDVMKFAKSLEGAKAKASTTGKPKRTRKRKPAEPDASKKLEHTVPAVPVYKTIHFYLRPGDTWPELLKDAREELGFAGPGTLIFAHEHLHSEECNDSCRGMS